MSLPLVSSKDDKVIFPEFNKVFPEYKTTIACSEENILEVIEKVASFVSKVYATFPQLEREAKEKLAKERVSFNYSWLDVSAPKSECEEFEATLKKTIISALSNKDKEGSFELTTDLYPVGILNEVAISTFKKLDFVGFYFPYETKTIIDFREKRTLLSVWLYFKS